MPPAAFLIGSSVGRADPIGAAVAEGAEVIQLHLSPPRAWRPPSPRGDEEDLAAWPGPIYVHAPYLLNPASVQASVRADTRRALQAQVAAAAVIGARGVVVHGGHPTGGGTTADGIAGWLEVVRGWQAAVPILIENSATGSAAVARSVDGLSRLWDAVTAVGANVGVCLDTCHAHAGGEELATVAERTLAACGRIDLVHSNDSKDAAGSGRDRHENLGAGRIDPDALIHVVVAAAAPCVVETPGRGTGHAADIAWLRARIAGLGRLGGVAPHSGAGTDAGAVSRRAGRAGRAAPAVAPAAGRSRPVGP
jgi:deoxyribonuclease IV